MLCVSFPRNSVAQGDQGQTANCTPISLRCTALHCTAREFRYREHLVGWVRTLLTYDGCAKVVGKTGARERDLDISGYGRELETRPFGTRPHAHHGTL